MPWHIHADVSCTDRKRRAVCTGHRHKDRLMHKHEQRAAITTLAAHNNVNHAEEILAEKT